MSALERTLFAIVSLLERSGYDYAVMGGLAVRVHSIPRPTHDVDLTIAIERSDLPELFASLEQLGHIIPESYRRGWVDQIAGLPLVKVRAYVGDCTGVDVDVFLGETIFQKSYLARRMEVTVGERRLSVVTPEDLILLKLLASRPRDLLDIADILFTQGQLDEEYMRTWAAQLKVSDKLQRVLTDSG